MEVAFDLYRLRWTVDEAGRVEIRAADDAGTELVHLRSTVPVGPLPYPVPTP